MNHTASTNERILTLIIWAIRPQAVRPDRVCHRARRKDRARGDSLGHIKTLRLDRHEGAGESG